MSLFWFHATRRPTADAYAAILREGCQPAPFVNETQQLELDLKITPNQVYCYLGRTLEQFGDFCIVFLPQQMPAGKMCPFDSGGLVRKIPPVNGWAEKERRGYLRALSFATRQAPDHLALYPATAKDAYLDCHRPTHSGPDEVWDGVPEADIWRQGTHWRAWTWEGRWNKIPLKGTVRAWSCAPALYMDIVEAIEAATDLPARIVDDFLARFRPGGVGALMADLRAEQAA